MSNVWFLFAHPDDEFAVTALVKDRHDAGQRVHCIYLTDGAFDKQSTSRRRDETLAVLARLGVDARQVHFVGDEQGFSDGALCRFLLSASDALRSLADKVGTPVEIFCPAWEGGHQDHDAVHLLALAASNQFGPGVNLRQFPLYNGAGLSGPFFRLLRTLPANGDTEVRAGRWRERLQQLRTGWSYPSQWRTWLGLFPFLAWHVITDGSFRTQAVDAARVKGAPHGGRLLYERRGFMTQVDFLAASEEFMESRLGSQAHE